jgi:hypothetical protein
MRVRRKCGFALSSPVIPVQTFASIMAVRSPTLEPKGHQQIFPSGAVLDFDIHNEASRNHWVNIK